MKNQKIIFGSACILLIAAFFIGRSVYQTKKEKQIEEIALTQSDTFVRSHSPNLGPADAPVTLVEFFDPECESCRMFHPYTKKLLADYSGKLRLILRYTPFHRNSIFAIKILEAARKQGKYWETLEKIFITQPQWGDHHNPKPELIWEFLPSLGLNIEKIKKEMEDPTISSIIQVDIKDGKTLNVRATPTFFVNGKQLTTFSYQALRNLIDSELAKN